MSYKQFLYMVGGGAAGAAQSLASTADIHIFTIPCRAHIHRIQMAITTTISSSASVVVQWDKRPYAGSDTDRGTADVGTLTIVTTTAAGIAVYEEPSTLITVNEGDQVVVQVSTAATSTGAGVPMLVLEPAPERPANNSQMLAA